MVKRATVIGVGLIGGSIAGGLRRAGWHVAGVDIDSDALAVAMQRGLIDQKGDDPLADITFVCVPVGVLQKTIEELLCESRRIVTDVGSAKAPVMRFLDHPNFVAGHPMAGSEQDGVEHARSDLFEHATWILCPSEKTDPVAYGVVQEAISALKANSIAIEPHTHDELVASISHLPHVVACSLMQLASQYSSEDNSPVLRLAGGGFRDMTRIAAGHPTLWADILIANSNAIVNEIERLESELVKWREDLQHSNRSALAERLARARMARRNLPVRGPSASEVVELRIPVPDRPGVLAEVTMLAGRLGVNISDIEISHDPVGDGGLLVLVVPQVQVHDFMKQLREQGYDPAMSPLDNDD